MTKKRRRQKKSGSDAAENEEVNTLVVEVKAKASPKKTREIDQDTADRIELLKVQKARAKGLFTRSKNKILRMDENEERSPEDDEEIRNERTKFEERFKSVYEVLNELIDVYLIIKETTELDKVTGELEKIEEEHNEVMDHMKEVLKFNTVIPQSVLMSQTENETDQSSVMQTMIALERRLSQLEVNPMNISSASNQHRVESQCRLDSNYAASIPPLRNQEYPEMRSQQQISSHVDIPITIEQRPDNYFRPSSPITSCVGVQSAASLHPTIANNNIYSNSSSYPHQPTGNNTENYHQLLGKDMWKQLNRVWIPDFNGDKRTYQSWKAAFYSCVDQAPATPEYKLLQMRHYLKGDALKLIEGLGHSAAAYESAKDRLERKYGGVRRQITINLEELDNFRPIRPGGGAAQEIEKLADLLDLIVINMRECGRETELQNGSLFLTISRKLTVNMLSDYQRWIFEQQMDESVLSLREWLIRESGFQTIASETIRGLSGRSREPIHNNKYSNFANSTDERRKTNRPSQNCNFCSGNHPIWKCEDFKEMSVDDRWTYAKENRLCYRCLGSGHRGANCPRTTPCMVDNCPDNHNSLLHDPTRSKVSNSFVGKVAESKSENEEEEEKLETFSHCAQRTESSEENNQNKVESYVGSKCPEPRMKRFISLRTIPVFLMSKDRTIEINALLDDGSNQTYINTGCS